MKLRNKAAEMGKMGVRRGNQRQVTPSVAYSFRMSSSFMRTWKGSYAGLRDYALGGIQWRGMRTIVSYILGINSPTRAFGWSRPSLRSTGW